MDKIETGFKFGKNKVEVLEQLGEVNHNGKTYRLLKVRVDDKEYISERLYNAHGKFIKQFMLEPEVGPKLGRLLDNGRLETAMQEAETKAWDSLARYKFQMFGYWASIWVHLNKISSGNRPNPWKPLVSQARRKELNES